MASLIDQAYDEAIASALSEAERARLLDAKRVSEIMRSIESPSNRKTIIVVLEKFDNLVDLADAIAERRIVPFPIRKPS